MPQTLNRSTTKITIIGAGPGGYEAALTASSLGAQVTLIEKNSPGGAAILTDALPSKNLIYYGNNITKISTLKNLGIIETLNNTNITHNLKTLNSHIKELTKKQSTDIQKKLLENKVKFIYGTAQITSQKTVTVKTKNNTNLTIQSDAIIIATGARPRKIPKSQIDGQQILDWTQIYNLKETPKKLIVIGSGVTGAELVSAYNKFGSKIVLISSRNQLLPKADKDAATLLEQIFIKRGITVISGQRAEKISKIDKQIHVTLSNGTEISGTHCLIAIGSIPNTENIATTNLDLQQDINGYILVDKVSRTSTSNIYAVGDCTGIMPLASVAAMQGRIAVQHILGEQLEPLNLTEVSENIFTAPEIATVGCSQDEIEQNKISANIHTISLDGNPKAKIMGTKSGFIKIFASPQSGIILGGVVVAPHASELIFPIALAVRKHLTITDIAATLTVYPSLSGSIAESARIHYNN